MKSSKFRFPAGLQTLLLFTALAASPALAQEYDEIGFYWANISKQDMVTSKGKRLTKLGDVLQQDRANFHRFGIRQQGDESDPVFSKRSNRALIPGLYREGGIEPGLEAKVRNGQPFGVGVFICGYGNRPTRLIAVPKEYGDHSGCF